MKLLVIEMDEFGEVEDVRDASSEERVEFFAANPEDYEFYYDTAFGGWSYVDEIYGPHAETIGYVVSGRVDE